MVEPHRGRNTPLPVLRAGSNSTLCVLSLVLLVSLITVNAASESLTDLSLEELMNVEVTSVSKKAERRQDAAAAIYVVTQEDIRRSGATNIPDVLRLVPGVNVSKLTSNTWSVTARGFGGRFANKLLVLIDGRSIYTPLFGGVYWEAQGVMLEDVDRIEVIRGPGGTLWGANAVNGVINIVTRHTRDTQGLLITGGAGTYERAFAAARWGGMVGDNLSYRVYTRYFLRDDGGTQATGGDARDEWNSIQGGGRIDWQISPDDELMLEADIHRVDLDEVITRAFLDPPLSREIPDDFDIMGRFVNTAWTHRFADDSQVQLRAYYDGYTADDVTFNEDRNTVDVEFEHQLLLGDRHGVVWGLGFRHAHDNTEGTEFLALDPESRGAQTYSAFIQDDIAINPKLHLILGTKIEHNDYTGVEVQPNARVRWSPNENHTIWAAVSRAVRTPSRAEDDIRIRYLTTPGPTEAILRGNRGFDSENLVATELGYRVRATERLAFDVALFFNHYTDIRTLEPGTPFVEDGVNILPFDARNDGKANTYGFEIAADWTPKDWWQVRSGYSFLKIDLDIPANDPVTDDFSRDTPQNQFFAQNRFNLPGNVELDATLRYVDDLDGIGIASYIEMDARIAWRPTEDLELALVGRNLFDNEHQEFAPTFVSHVPSAVEREVYGKITWRFQPGTNR
jgi:iron complex outermembrane receptor protein